MIRLAAMVQTMMGRLCAPVFSTTDRFSPKPSSTTAHCSTFLLVKRMPGAQTPLFFQNREMIMPARMAMTGPPMMGNICPSRWLGTAITRQSSTPCHMVLSS